MQEKQGSHQWLLAHCKNRATVWISPLDSSDMELARLLQSRQFQSVNKVTNASHDDLKGLAKNGCQKCFDELYKLRQKRAVAQGTATAGSDVVQSGRPVFDDFFQHLWPYIGNNTANVVFQMVKRFWLIRIDQ
ncbi:hypothetical protein TNCV_4242891 [Trichonephila clavipes]|nr:hypothetical protein TNCV_4242891 [Trichonephila clavipes]